MLMVELMLWMTHQWLQAANAPCGTFDAEKRPCNAL
jgi:hypothetical protein